MLAGEHRIAMGLHNHSGTYVGEAVWDTWEMIHDLDPRWTGFYYDPGHAAIEGGLGGHDVSMHLALPRLKMVAVKDFFWRKDAAGWKSVWCPMGEGAVDWKSRLGTLRKAGYSGPISLHAEYQFGYGWRRCAKISRFSVPLWRRREAGSAICIIIRPPA